MTVTTIDRDMGPKTLDDFVGQPDLKARLAVHIQAAIAAKRPLPHTLLLGNPGTGKSTIAHLIAAELTDPIVTLSKEPTEKQLLNTLMDLSSGICLVDEIHDWSTKAQNWLLPLLEAGVLEGKYGSIEFPWLTVIGATTDRRKLHPALRSRFKIVPLLEDYTDDEMTEIVAGFAQRAGISLDEETCRALGVAAVGMPREARSLVESARDMIACGQHPTADEILGFCSVEADGMTHDHMAYLRALDKNRGCAGIESLCTRLRMHKIDIGRLEHLLFDKGYVINDSTGRILTAAGRRRVAGDVDVKPRGRFA